MSRYCPAHHTYWSRDDLWVTWWEGGDEHEAAFRLEGTTGNLLLWKVKLPELQTPLVIGNEKRADPTLGLIPDGLKDTLRARHTLRNHPDADVRGSDRQLALEAIRERSTPLTTAKAADEIEQWTTDPDAMRAVLDRARDDGLVVPSKPEVA